MKRDPAEPPMDREAKIRAMVAKLRGQAAEAPRPPAAQKEFDWAAGEVAVDEDVPRPPPTAPQRRVQSPGDPKAQLKEDEDGKKLQSLLPGLEEKVGAAEDEVDKVSVSAAVLTMDPTKDLKVVQLTAVRDTERAYKAAALSFTALKRELDRRVGEVESFAPVAKYSATMELGKLTKRFSDASAKLEEYKNVRRDFEMAVAAEKLLEELASRLAGVEMDCDKAVMMTEPLSKAMDTGVEVVNTAEVRGAKEALRVAQGMLAPTMRLISGKVPSLKGNLHRKMSKLLERAEASNASLERASQVVDEAQSRVTAAPLVREAQGRISAVEAAVQKMRESETPFLMGIETIGATETAEVLEAMDSAVKEAQTAIADGQKFVQLKKVEVGRLASGAAQAAKQELERVQEQLNFHQEKVKKFSIDAAKKKRVNIVDIIKYKVELAESAVGKLKEAGAELQESTTETLVDVLERARAVEEEAQNAVSAARKELQAKQPELRPVEGIANPEVLKSSSEILKTKVRVNYTEAELTKFRKVCKEFEEKMKVEQSLADISGTLTEAEVEIDRLTEVSQEWPTDQKAPEEEEANMNGVQAKLNDTFAQVEKKLSKAQGMELKQLRAVFGKMKAAQHKLDRVKEIARDRSRFVSQKIVGEAAAAMKKAEEKVNVIVRAASSTGAQTSLSKLEGLKNDSAAALECLAEARAALNHNQAYTLVNEARTEWMRLQMRSATAEKRGKAAAETLVSRYETAANNTVTQALTSLRAAARLGDGSYDANALFDSLSDGSGQVGQSDFLEFFTRRRDAGDSKALSDEQASFVFTRLAPNGMPRRAFTAAIADYLKVIKDITITSEFEIQTSKKLRKLELDEVIEALGAPRHDPALGLERVLCRTLRDGLTGWVTIKSTSGVIYLDRGEKPFLWCRETVSIREEIEPASMMLRPLNPGEVVELVEGPREDKSGADKRVRGVACNGDATGWLHVRDQAGTILAKLSARVHKCVDGVDMTDISDAEKGSVVRCIDPGEALELLEGESVTPEDGGTRCKFRACLDNAEGWVTTNGGHGEVYVKAAAKHFLCLQEAPMHSGLGAESAVVKVLMPGEAFAAFEDPKNVAGSERFTQWRVRAVTDGVEGWITTTNAEEVQPWSHKYKVLRNTTLTVDLNLHEAAGLVQVLRQLDQGELVEACEQPVEDPSTGKLRLRCVAVRDRAAGFATVREGGGLGVMLMRPLGELEGAGLSDAIGGGEAAPTTPPLAAPPLAAPSRKRPNEDGAEAKGKGKGGKRFLKGSK